MISAETRNLHVIDYVVLGVYFVIVLLVGIIPTVYKRVKSRWVNRVDQQREGSEEGGDEEELSFFLAGRSMGVIAVGASLFSSNIGSEHFIGLSGSGAQEGIAIGWYEWSAVFILAVLAYIFVPLYLQSKIYTTPEFIEKRFHRYIRSYLAIISLFFYVFTKISVTIFAVALVLETVLGWNLYVSSVVILVATGVYTITGGLSAVIYTEVLQSVVLVGGAILLTILGFAKVGGLANLMKAERNSFHMFKPLNDPGLPWLGVLTGVPISGLQYWCGDQVIVQRVLSARSAPVAQFGCAIASILKILPVFILVMPGIISKHLYPTELAKSGDRAFPLLVVRIMPPFAKGLLIASMLAAAMSSLASVFNSASTIFVMDVYKLLRKRGKSWEYVLVGRISILVLIVVSLAWLPIITQISDQLFVYIQSMQSYMMPPLTSLFFCGVFWWRVNTFGTAVSLGFGLLLGMTRFVLEAIWKSKNGKMINSKNPFIYVFTEMNYLYFAFMLFGVSVIITIVFSLLTPQRWRQDREAIKAYTVQWGDVWNSCSGWKYQKQQDDDAQQEEQSTTASELPDEQELEENPEIDVSDTVTESSVAPKEEDEDIEEDVKPRKELAIYSYSWVIYVAIITPVMAFLFVYFR